MIRVTNKEIRTYFSKVTLSTTSGEEIIYTDTPSTYEAMVDKFKHIHACKIEPVELTEEQQARLTALQSLVGELEEKSEPQAANFVKDGYISPFDNCDGGVCQIQPMLKLLAKWEGVSKNALLKSYKTQLGKIRLVRETGGVKFNGMTCGSEKEDQNSISNTVLVLEKTGINTVKFKFKDGWQELDLKALIQLAAKVATHVQICFEVEEAIVSKLSLLPLKELANMVENPYENKRGDDVPSIEQMYNSTVDQQEATMDN